MNPNVIIKNFITTYTHLNSFIKNLASPTIPGNPQKTTKIGVLFFTYYLIYKKYQFNSINIMIKKL